ncbi:hypothetical protein, unlikely [Trypanosoma brucei gambiense DAL972]|uniref:Uncharacterized protein n=1 Tax=Trypanosoma brucei gambiense (strain MHOM/CI/86/DAL972) TaxID=679716 RepID=C9ZLT0_TRYB9|nr:hypothetical protein, unlikely [Trypanosoma brucei gambiense DAL972]CBH10355.1 hypothetical protein, unlikely [Trypanosoma brucei gambiense DAL972]|eukprot:XP_011772645.1 hypothetical protein, unlikely [Trypanosoma brucei gambiense DAL972]
MSTHKQKYVYVSANKQRQKNRGSLRPLRVLPFVPYSKPYLPTTASLPLFFLTNSLLHSHPMGCQRLSSSESHNRDLPPTSNAERGREKLSRNETKTTAPSKV